MKCHITQPSGRTEPGHVVLTVNLSTILLHFHSSCWLFIYLFYSFTGNLSGNVGSLKSVFGIMTTFFYSPKCPDRLSGSSSFLLYGQSDLLPGGVRRPGRDTNHSHPSNAMVKMREAIIYSPRAFIVRRDFTFTYIFASAKTHFLHYKNEQQT